MTTSPQTTVRVEFFGLLRHRTGVPAVEITATTLGEAVAQLRASAPSVADICLDGDQLKAGYLASINGRLFVTDPATPLQHGDSLLILSADVGG